MSLQGTKADRGKNNEVKKFLPPDLQFPAQSTLFRNQLRILLRPQRCKNGTIESYQVVPAGSVLL